MSFDLSIIENEIKNHMENQPYELKCDKCGVNLNFTKNVDNDFDLLISIEPCNCQKITGE